MMRYGQLLMNYFNKSDCSGKPSEKVNYSVRNNETIKILNSDNTAENYSYTYDFFSNEIYYTNGSVDDIGNVEEDSDIYINGFICNGQCYKRGVGSDILVKIDFEPNEYYDYDTMNEKCKYYSCIYNNIIESATIEVTRYSDKKCKTVVNNYTFLGSETCWKVESNYTFKPLYYEDTNDKVYYHAYNSDDCTSSSFDYFKMDENYLKCDSKCQQNETDKETSYKCKFSANFGQKRLNFCKFFIFLILIHLF